MFYIIALSLLSMLFRPNAVLADSYQGQAEQHNISVDKKIYLNTNKAFVDNIDKSQKVFVNGDVVEFSITVENTGSQDLTDIKVSDKLPLYLGLYFYPGTLNKSSNVINWTIDRLSPGEKKSYSIRAKLVNIPSKNFDSKQSNFVEASANGVSDNDTATYFIGAATVPVTGNEAIILETIMGLGIAFAGLKARKLARGF